MRDILVGPPLSTLEILLDDPDEHDFPAAVHILRGLTAEKALDRVLYPATERELAWTVGYKLACGVATHTAYHFGQIVVLRRCSAPGTRRPREAGVPPSGQDEGPAPPG